MATELMARPDGVLAPFGDVLVERAKLDLLRETIAKDATPLEFEMFVEFCRSKKLDPFAKQIYMIRRGGSWTFQIGIDGFRLIFVLGVE